MRYLALFIYLLALPAFAQESTESGAVMLIDVRSTEEYQSGHAEGAININFTAIQIGVAEQNISKDTHIYLYCGSGKRAGIALNSLRQAGYENVTNLGGLERAKAFVGNN